eukprot:symbB.v1.2.034435.t1/scaffold4444.1/size39528/2
MSSLRNSFNSAASVGSVSSVESTFTPTSPLRGKPWSPFEKMEHWGDEMGKADSNDTIDFAKNHTMHYRDAKVEAFLKQHGFSNIHGDRDRPTMRSFGSFESLLRMTGTGIEGNEILYPIHIAAKTGNYEMLLLLLASGADPTICTSEGRSAIDIVRQVNQDGSHLDILELLIDIEPISRPSRRSASRLKVRETRETFDFLLQDPILVVSL